MTAAKQYASVDEYIQCFPQDTQIILQSIRDIIHTVAPDAIETISYNMPTFELNGKHLVFFAGWKEYISLYPIPIGDDAFQKRIAPYKKGKGTLRFPIDRAIPYELLIKIITLLIEGKTTYM